VNSILGMLRYKIAVNQPGPSPLFSWVLKVSIKTKNLILNLFNPVKAKKSKFLLLPPMTRWRLPTNGNLHI